MLKLGYEKMNDIEHPSKELVVSFLKRLSKILEKSSDLDFDVIVMNTIDETGSIIYDIKIKYDKKNYIDNLMVMLQDDIVNYE